MTKEQMIEKIRKTVIVANNPRCKSYGEALMHDIRFNKQECEVLLKETNQIIKWYDISKTTTFDYELMGQPLTLERVWVALKQYNNYCYGHNHIIFLIQQIEKYSYIFVDICTWQPNQTLDNQSDETIRAVYNILCDD